jgi:hypothetical protein
MDGETLGVADEIGVSSKKLVYGKDSGEDFSGDDWLEDLNDGLDGGYQSGFELTFCVGDRWHDHCSQ